MPLLSATWAPGDTRLAASGQFDDVVVHETTLPGRAPGGARLRFDAPATAVAFSPDGRMLATGTGAGLVVLFDVADHRDEAEQEEEVDDSEEEEDDDGDDDDVPETLYETVIGTGEVASIRWTPDGRRIAVASGSTFVLLLDSSAATASAVVDICADDDHHDGDEEGGRTRTSPRRDYRRRRHPRRRRGSSARFLVDGAIQNNGGACALDFSSLSVCPRSRHVALSDRDSTRILDVSSPGSPVARTFERCSPGIKGGSDGSDGGHHHAYYSSSSSSAWNDDGSLFASVAGPACSDLAILDSSPSSPAEWTPLFSISLRAGISSLCWGPQRTPPPHLSAADRVVDGGDGGGDGARRRGLDYLAFGGDGGTCAVLELRTGGEGAATWETVLQVPPPNRDRNDNYDDDEGGEKATVANVTALEWNRDGMMCAGDERGVASAFDLSYLGDGGRAVSEMSYNWQRQGVVSRTELTRTDGGGGGGEGESAIASLCWRPRGAAAAAAGDGGGCQVAIGWTDGVCEIFDLSERR